MILIKIIIYLWSDIMKKNIVKISGKEINELHKKLVKDKVTVNEALLFIFKEMIDNKSQQLQMQMSNDKGEEIELCVTLDADFLQNKQKKENQHPDKYSVPYFN